MNPLTYKCGCCGGEYRPGDAHTCSCVLRPIETFSPPLVAGPVTTTSTMEPKCPKCGGVVDKTGKCWRVGCVMEKQDEEERERAHEKRRAEAWTNFVASALIVGMGTAQAAKWADEAMTEFDKRWGHLKG